MRVVVVAYEGVDIWDMAVPYEILRQHSDFEVIIATNTPEGRILSKDKNLLITGLSDIRNIETTDVLWLCSGEAKIEELSKDERFKIDLTRLVVSAKKVVAIGAASTLLLGLLVTDYKAVCSHPVFASKIKKAKATYSKELLLSNEKLISTTTRVGALISAFMILREYAGEDFSNQLLLSYAFDKNLVHPETAREMPKRDKHLKRLYKQTIVRKPNPALNSVSVDAPGKSLCIYLQEGLNALSFALFYGLMSNYQLLDIYLAADKKAALVVEGGGFGLMPTHSLHQIKRVHTLVLTGGEVVDKRLADTYLKFWVSELCPRCSLVIALDGSEKIVGASGALASYDPAFEDDEGNGKFVFFDSPGLMLNWLKAKLPAMVGEVQAELYLSEYYC